MAGNVASATVFTLENRCSYTLWPGTLSGNGGFFLQPGSSFHLTAPLGWSGRFWARTGCNFYNAGNRKSVTGDCGGLRCVGGGALPVKLAEFTIGSASNNKDFYDVSLVHGYIVGMSVKATGGTGDCQYAGCVADLNLHCPSELQVMDGSSVVACKSACAEFNTAEFCCTGDHSSLFADAVLGDVQRTHAPLPTATHTTTLRALAHVLDLTTLSHFVQRYPHELMITVLFAIWIVEADIF